MESKNILISGVESEIGLALSMILQQKQHNIGIIVRDDAQKQAIASSLETTNPPLFFVADLTDRNGIKDLVEAIKSTWTTVDVFFNTAEVILNTLQFSVYGNEMQLEINAILPYLLTEALQPLFEKSPNPKVINLALGGIQNIDNVEVAHLKTPLKFTSKTSSYTDSKLAMVLMMNYLAVQTNGVQILSVDPGALKNKVIPGDAIPFWMKPLRNLFNVSAKKGAMALYDAAFETTYDGNGLFISAGEPLPMRYTLSKMELEKILS